jgi:hypothetical protein
VPNPEGRNGAQFRPYTAAMEMISTAPLPEHLRLALNVIYKQQLYNGLHEHPDFLTLLPEDIPDLYPKKISWAQANAIRLHSAAVLEGDYLASVECRESVEGRSVARVEFTSSNDKLEALLECFRKAAKQAADETAAAEASAVPKLVQ